MKSTLTRDCVVLQNSRRVSIVFSRVRDWGGEGEGSAEDSSMDSSQPPTQLRLFKRACSFPYRFRHTRLRRTRSCFGCRCLAVTPPLTQAGRQPLGLRMPWMKRLSRTPASALLPSKTRFPGYPAAAVAAAATAMLGVIGGPALEMGVRKAAAGTRSSTLRLRWSC